MNRHFRKGGKVFFLSGVISLFFLDPSVAWADYGMTSEEESQFSALVGLTVLSSLVTAAVCACYNWRCQGNEWVVLLRSAAAIFIITFLSFDVGLRPLLHRIEIPEAIEVLYLPSSMMGFVLMAAGLWMKTLLDEREALQELALRVKEEGAKRIKELSIKTSRKSLKKKASNPTPKQAIALSDFPSIRKSQVGNKQILPHQES